MKKLGTLGILIMVSVLLLSCASNDYQKVIKNKQGIGFSFECPTTYQDQETTQISFEYKSQVVFLRPYGETIALDRSNINSDFFVNIYTANHVFLNARAYLNDMLDNSTDNPDFELFSLTKTEVCGVVGEYVSYKVRFGWRGDTLDSRVSYCKEIYLDYKEKIIIIGTTYYQDMNAQVEKEFAHIIDSFKFLD